MSLERLYTRINPMPEINDRTERAVLNHVKFIRVEETIYYSSDPDAHHSTIANEFGVQESIKKGEFTYPVVDDAGIMEMRDGLLVFTGDTNTCQIRGGFRDARVKTIRIAMGIFGKKKVADPSVI